MKKFFTMLFCLMAIVFASCTSYYEVGANYDVCYPDGTKTYDETMLVSCRKGLTPSVVSGSVSGTNYISIKETKQTYISTTAPLRLNNYNVKTYKRKEWINRYEYPKDK